MIHELNIVGRRKILDLSLNKNRILYIINDYKNYMIISICIKSFIKILMIETRVKNAKSLERSYFHEFSLMKVHRN